MPGLGGTETSTAATTNTLKSFGGLLPAIPGQGILNAGAGILGIATSASPLGAVAFGIGTITNIFSKHHTQALATEAQTLNQATPAFLQSVSALFAALNAGQVSASDAISYLDQIQSAYYSSVQGILKKSGTCKPEATDHGDRLHTDGMSACNAACSIGCRTVESAVYQLKKIIQAGGGSYTIPGVAQNGQINAFPSITLSYSGGAGTAPKPVSTGLVAGGQTPVSIGALGTPVGNGIIVPFSSQSGATPAPAGTVQQAGVAGAAPAEASTILGLSTTNFVIIAAILAVAVVTVAGLAGEHRRR